MMISLKIIALSLLLSFLFSCGSYTPETPSKEETLSAKIENSMIKTFIIAVTKNNEAIEFNITNTIVSKGYLKPEDFSVLKEDPDLFICEVLDKKGNILQKTQIHNPLIGHYEYEEHGSKEMKKKTIHKEEGSIAIRLNDTPNISSINIKESINPQRIIYTINL